MLTASYENCKETPMARQSDPKPDTRRLQVDVRPETLDALRSWAREELKPMAVVVRQILDDAVVDREDRGDG